ncbi:MAG: N-acetylmuramoyl-L-alanine amidase [Bacteroidota bacterium]
MHRLPLLFCFYLFCSFPAFAEDPYFHRVPARSGDNIHTLLERYELDDQRCNFDKFYQLNELNKSSQLREGRKYYIPVLIYRYNGKSIRTTLGLATWEQAYRIKKYNERILAENLRKKTLEKSRILWVPYHELHCLGKATSDPPTATKPPETTPQQPSTAEKEAEAEARIAAIEQPQNKIDENTLREAKKISGYRKFPIFGKRNAYIPLLDNKLRGKVFYVVSGHGGPDSGAVGKKGNQQLCEDEYAYDVALRLVRNLLQHGAIAYMITRDPNDGLRSGEYLPCDTDEYCWGNYKIPRSQKTRLFQRSDAINKLYKRHRSQGIKDQTALVIHIDSRSTRETTDVFFYYFPGSKTGKRLAQNIRKTFKEKYKKYRKNGRYEGTVTPRDLHMLREVKPNSVFIELGNIRNPYDQQRFIKESNRDALAKWLYEGLIR